MKIRVFAAAAFVLLMVLVPAVTAQKEKSRSDLLSEIVKLSNSKKPEEQKKAYDLSKEFLKRFGNEDKEDVKKIKDFQSRFRSFMFLDAADKSRNDEVLTLGREILAEQPENVVVLMNMALAGYRTADQGIGSSLAEELAGYSRKAAELIEAGKVTNNDYSPFADRNTSLGWMYVFDAYFTQGKDRKASASAYYRAALAKGQTQSSAMAYYGLASYYESIYEAFSIEFNAKRNSMSEAEFKTATERSEKIVDTMMDAYARAVKTAEADKLPAAAAWRERLAQIYTYRKKSAAGLPEYIAGIDAKTLPDPAKL